LIVDSSDHLVAAESSSLIATGAKVEKLAGGFEFTEGAAHDTKGNIYFSDIPNSRIHIWSIDGKLSTFRENSGEANGLDFDAKGNLLACEGKTRQLTSMSPDGKVTVLADRYNGKKLNSPNDLWVDPQGGVYFSDPRYGKKDGVEQDGHHVYYLAQGAKQLERVIADMKRPNGLVGTPDGKQLYITDEGSDKVFVYQIGKGGKLGSRRLLVEKGSDGMTLDSKGNLYITNESVWIYSPEGKLLEEIKLPEGAANVSFGGIDHKTLFITARKGLYALKMNVTGW
jgi:gluconolactonase